MRAASRSASVELKSGFAAKRRSRVAAAAPASPFRNSAMASPSIPPGSVLMHPGERALIEGDGLVMTPKTDAFVRQCPQISDARHGFDRTRELTVLTCRIE